MAQLPTKKELLNLPVRLINPHLHVHFLSCMESQDHQKLWKLQLPLFKS
jgi:hypothetical protein